MVIAGDSAATPTSTGSPSSGPAPDASPSVALVYQGLMTKWLASRALLWQFPALTLTAQAFLIGASVQLANGNVVDRLLLSLAVAAIGVASILMQLKAGNEQHLDLVMIDHLESVILADRADLLLWHSSPLDQRIAKLVTSDLGDELRSNYLWRFNKRGKWPSLGVRISFTWATMQALVSLVGALVGLIR